MICDVVVFSNVWITPDYGDVMLYFDTTPEILHMYNTYPTLVT